MRLDKPHDSEGGSSSGFPISSGPTLLIKDKRFSLEHDAKPRGGGSSFTLSITDVQASDSSTYQCQVVVSLHNMITADAKLQVKLPPVMNDLGETRTVRAKVGDQALLNCEASGFPLPRMTWSRVDGHVLPNGKENATVQVLKIARVRKEDRGKQN